MSETRLSRLLVLFLVGWTLPLMGAVDAFLKIEGIPGESTDSAHGGWIDVHSFGTGIELSRTSALSSGFKFTKQIDKATPLLMRACAIGEPIAEARLELVRPAPNGGLRFYEMALGNVRVASLETAAGQEDAVPTEETLLLMAETLSWTYTQFDDGGRAVGDLTLLWDFVRNEGALEDSNVFRVSARMDEDAFRLSWHAHRDRTYRILAGEQVDGSYSVIETITAESTGDLSITLPAVAAGRFFIVERQ